MSQLLKSVCLEPVLHNGRSHRNEKPTHSKEEWPLLTATRESLCCSNDPAEPQIICFFKGKVHESGPLDRVSISEDSETQPPSGEPGDQAEDIRVQDVRENVSTLCVDVHDDHCFVAWE